MVFWSGKKRQRNAVFGKSENSGPSRLDPSFGSPQDGDSQDPQENTSSEINADDCPPVPEGLADRTCQKIWEEVDRTDPDDSTTSTGSSGRTVPRSTFHTEDIPSSDRPTRQSVPRYSRIIPKIPRMSFSRGAFVPKSMTIYEVDAPPEVSRAPSGHATSRDPVPSPISSEPIQIAPRPYSVKVMYSLPIEIQRESGNRATLLYAETLLILSRPSVGIPTLSFADPTPVAPTRMYSAPLYVENRPFETTVLYQHPVEVQRCPFRRTVMHVAPLVVLPAPYTIRQMYAEPLLVSDPPYHKVQQYSVPADVALCPYRFTEMYETPLLVASAPYTNSEQYDRPLTIDPAPYTNSEQYDYPLTVDPAPYTNSEQYGHPLTVDPAPYTICVMYTEPLRVSGPPYRKVPQYSVPADVAPCPYRFTEMYEVPLLVASAPYVACEQYDHPLAIALAPRAARGAADRKHTSKADLAALAELKRRFNEEQNRPRRRKRPRSPLRNGEIREEFRDEYYWELLAPEVEPVVKPHEQQALAAAPVEDESENVITQTVERIGSTTISEVRLISQWLGGRPIKAASKPRRQTKTKESKWYPSDLLISVVGGVLIAVVVVLPILRFFGQELAIVIAKSTVRQIGQKVPVNADSSFLEHLPYLAEALHPQFQEEVLEDPVAPASALAPTQSALEFLFPESGIQIENLPLESIGED